jgi:2-polyprenyl-3-methyl-5-hydroxy-6-metoxy-1,4-benzoquinol methylase
MDQSRVDTFAERLVTEINSGMSCLNLHLGLRLGLYQAIADAGSIGSAELARRIGYNERYLREWLECMVVGGYLEYASETARFSIPSEHTAVLLDRDNAAYLGSLIAYIPIFAGVLNPLMEAFRTGGGVPFAAYGPEMVESASMANRPVFIHDYVAKWIPALPDIEARLRTGGRVAEIGCGAGWSSISLAQGFRNAWVDGVDTDAASIEQARLNAQQAGVADRVTFHAGTAEETSLNPPYDLVTAIECLHDMAYPVRALRRMRELVDPDGAVFIADEAVGDNLAENHNFSGHLFYNVSVLHCLPQAMVFPDTAGTGAVMGTSTVRKYAREAGFAQIEVLPIENAFWRFYRLVP